MHNCPDVWGALVYSAGDVLLSCHLHCFFPISASSPGDVEAKDSNLHDVSHYSVALVVRGG